MNDGIELTGLDELVAQVPDGAIVALPTGVNADFSGVPMAATRALIRRGVKDLNLVLVPASGIQADLLIGAGCVATVQTGSILLYEYGRANRFVAAQKRGTIRVRESTCPAIHAALIAGEKGLPFMPVRGIIGSDLLRHRQAEGDWKVIDNPFGENDPIVVVSAIRPDVTMLHVPMADRMGNIWVGRRHEFSTMARGAHRTLATFERLYDGDMRADATLAPGVVPALYVAGLCHQPRGAWPLHMGKDYPEDSENMREYARLSPTDEGFAEYLSRFVFGYCEAA